MGTYPEPPSYVLSTGEELHTAIDKDPDTLLGKNIIRKFNGNTTLPYLAKVLSIRKALPLQLHPNKEMAAELHKAHPSSFTDPNHKPEIAIALTRFEAFCGFREFRDIETKMRQLEPLRRFLPPGMAEEKHTRFDKSSLKHVVQAILKAPARVITETVEKLRELPRDAFSRDTYILDLLPRLWDQYDKSDPGLLVALLVIAPYSPIMFFEFFNADIWLLWLELL